MRCEKLSAEFTIIIPLHYITFWSESSEIMTITVSYLLCFFLFLHIFQGPIRSTQNIFHSNFYAITVYVIWPCILTYVFSWLTYRTASYLHQYAYAGSIQLLVSHHLFQMFLVEKETHMFYVASVITFSVFLDLLWNYTLYLYITS